MEDCEAALDDNDDDVDAMIECLNDDQLRVFDTVRSHVHTQHLSSQMENTEPLQQLLLVVSTKFRTLVALPKTYPSNLVRFQLKFREI